MPEKDKIITLINRLISDGDRLVAKATPSNYSLHIKDIEGLRRWSNDLILLRSLAGNMIQPWVSRLNHNGIVIMAEEVERPLSTLRTIRAAIEDGLLMRYEDLIMADTFADLSAQASHLLSQGYFLAAGVILRAVLEERLRTMCARHGVLPSKARPTISDFNQALYGAAPPVYDKSMMLHVTALASIGNDAAHNVETLKREDVGRLEVGLQDFLARFST